MKNIMPIIAFSDLIFFFTPSIYFKFLKKKLKIKLRLNLVQKESYTDSDNSTKFCEFKVYRKGKKYHIKTDSIFINFYIY